LPLCECEFLQFIFLPSYIEDIGHTSDQLALYITFIDPSFGLYGIPLPPYLRNPNIFYAFEEAGLSYPGGISGTRRPSSRLQDRSHFDLSRFWICRRHCKSLGHSTWICHSRLQRTWWCCECPGIQLSAGYILRNPRSKNALNYGLCGYTYQDI